MLTNAVQQEDFLLYSVQAINICKKKKKKKKDYISEVYNMKFLAQKFYVVSIYG